MYAQMRIAGFFALGSVVLLSVGVTVSAQPEPASEKDAEVDAGQQDEGPRRVVLPGPTLQDWQPQSLAAKTPHTDNRYPLYAKAHYHNAPIFWKRKQRFGRGIVRAGSWIPVGWLGSRKGCARGYWYAVAGGGYICTTRGFNVFERHPARDSNTKQAATEAPLPFVYAEVIAKDGIRFKRVPTADELAVLSEQADETDLPDPALDRMQGDYYLALDRRVQGPDDKVFFRTVRGHYVLEEDVDIVTMPEMHGVHIKSPSQFPVAFVVGDEPAPVYQVEDQSLRLIGYAEKHAHLFVERRVDIGGKSYWVSADKRALPEERVNVPRYHSPPKGVTRNQRWLHVDLKEQAIVAYKGKRPVFATLISSGKEGYDTPTGQYVIHHKYISITMRGDDPNDGRYEVEEVPWTQYYDDNFAIHGAYWHDDFGQVRSHGCTNVAPADARWLFYFTAPKVPTGWHGVLDEGTTVLFTD